MRAPLRRTAMMARFVCLIANVLALAGCAPLSQPKPSHALPQAKLATDAVVLDIAFVRLRAADSETYEAIWNAADEQHFASDLRTRLATNGLRIGLYGQQLPSLLRELLEARPSTIEELSEGATSELQIGGSRQHLPVRAGHRSIIKASKVHPSL